ncbi:DUF2723 domain-containing protein [Myxococcota bacterium]|nr:DUF2723 domain-containing protein [Myxococcota bacterium]MBU1536431.1 DUF2723 domain-containing protein [Myxococcota bacterium]
MNFKKAKQILVAHEGTISLHLAWLIPFVVYIISLPPGVTWGDSPELSNAAITLGVAHPSGYPLFTLLGKLFSLLPFSTPAFGIGLMDALLEALAVLFVFLSIRQITGRTWISLFSALFFAFTYTFWMHGRIVEVYALNNFLLGGVLYSMIRWIKERKLKHLYLMSLFFGLGFTNHLTMVLFFPAVVFLFLSTQPRQIFRLKPLGIMVGIILTLQLLYLYIPWAAAHSGGDTLAWNSPTSWSRFFYHVTGREYAVFRKGSSLEAGINRFALTFIKEFGVMGSFLTLVGAIELLLSNWRLGVTLLISFAAMVIYNATYAVQDITSYYMAPYMICAVSMGVGISWLSTVRAGKGRFSQYAEYVFPLLLILAGLHLYGQNRSLKYRDNLAHYFGEQAFGALPARSILITDIDGPSFAMMYQAYAVHNDPSRVVITKGMYSDKGKVWYRDFLRKRHPGVQWPPEGTYGDSIIRKLIAMNYGTHQLFTAFYFRTPLTPYQYVNRGWISRILLPKDIPEGVKPNSDLRWAYLTTVKYVGQNEWYPNSVTTFSPGDILGCVAEWIFKHKGVNVTWEITHPSGKTLGRFSRFVSAAEPISAYKMKILPTHIYPGTFTCSITINGSTGSVLPFTVSR